MQNLFLIVLLTACFPVFASQNIILSCGNLFDSKSATLIGPRWIIVDGNKIKSVNKEAVKLDGANELDLKDYTCLPGFIDLHVHLSNESNSKALLDRFQLDDIDFAFRSVGFAEKTLMAGFTTVRDLGGLVALHLRDAINRGFIKGPRIFASGRTITSTGGHGDATNGYNSELSRLKGPLGPTEGIINGTDGAKQAVRQRYKEGSDLIKIAATGGVLSEARSADAPLLSLDEIKEIVETAKDYGFAVAAHAHGKEGAKRAVLAGVTSIEHGTYLDDEVLSLMKKRGTWYVPTLCAGKFVAEKAKEEGFYTDVVKPKAARLGPLMQATFAKGYKSGVKIAFGTDTGVSLHGNNADEFVLMNQSGMPANTALQTATYNAALVLGNPDIGNIEAGKLADVIAVKGNPLLDISLTKKVEFVMKDGNVYKSAKP